MLIFCFLIYWSPMMCRELVGPDTRLFYVGKTAEYHSRTQEEIHELLMSFAEAGATFVRLKGGDRVL